jgi:acetyl esterase/lipase/lysophospholipase L1-like esterase
MKYYLLLFAFIINSFSMSAQQTLPLYPGKVPNSLPVKNRESVTEENGIVKIINVTEPALIVFLPPPALATGTAIIICPGGAYSFLASGHEGKDVATELNKAGIAAFILKYRLPNDAVMTNKDQVPLQDAQQAIKTVRDRAAEWHVNSGKIGIMGFSAGGHLAACAGTHYEPALIENTSHTNLRPDFMALVYPVISFQDNIGHGGSRENLLGTKISKEKKDYYSNELNVTANTPTTFLVHASDDSGVVVANSIVFYEALVKHYVPVEMHLYEQGGHGFGMLKNKLITDGWLYTMIDWLKQKKMLEPLTVAANTPVQKSEPNAVIRSNPNDPDLKKWWSGNQFAAANKTLKPALPGEPRIVFMGNSITSSWLSFDSIFFSNEAFVNRGISGQTTPQMLLRFREDVLDLKPAVVVILAGINDIAGNTGPTTLENIFGNIASMAELAKMNHIKVVLSSVLPAFDFPWRPGLEPAEKIAALNDMLKSYAAKNNLVYVDYYSSMVDERKGLKKELTYDGVHPNLAGYKVMEPLVEAAIKKALKQK